VILAFESSCDESAIALFDPSCGIAGEWIHSQIALHSEHGGVVPDIATREHLKHFAPLLKKAMENGGWPRVSKVAVTRGPGLAACLAIGVAAAKSVAAALKLPVVGVNHLRAHAWSPFISVHARNPCEFPGELSALLPHLGLIVSGGNTLLFSVSQARAITAISSTRDDAAGEALDKGAKLLGIGYPGGPAIERLARVGRPDAFDFPRGIGKRGDLDFSFSGLKTSLRYQLEKMPPADIAAALPDLCASYQQAVIDALTRKTAFALESGFLAAEKSAAAVTPPADVESSMLNVERFAPTPRVFRSLGLSGGVANNRPLRAALGQVARAARVPLLAAEPRHTGDNAAMIAFAAYADPSHTVSSQPGKPLAFEPSLPLISEAATMTSLSHV
jgi:N6-L-threonylcarbamoyladenine synthase